MKPLVGLLGVILAAFAAEFNDQVPAVAISDISGGLRLSHDPGTWFNSLYITGETVGMALAPWLATTFTLRQFSLFALLLNALTSALIPFSPALGALYMLRSLQGVSGGFTIPLLMITALRALDPKIRLYGLSVYALTATLTPGLATPLAALWTSRIGWQFIFLEALPLCVMAAALVAYGDPQDPPKYERLRNFDWRGALLVLIGFGSLSTLLQQGDRLDWFNSGLVCVLALISAVAIPIFVLNEWFHPLPLMKFQLLGRRNIAFGGITLLTFVVISQSSSTLPTTFLQQVAGFRPEQIYPITLALAVSQLALLPLTAFLLDFRTVDARVVNFIGLALILASCLGGSLLTGDWRPRQFFLWQGMQAVGQPMVVMSLLLLATNAVKGPDEAPFASALVNTPRAVAEALGVWLLQLVQRWRGGLHYNRIVDQLGQSRYRLLQAPQILPQHPPPLLPNGSAVAADSVALLGRAVDVQASVLTLSDTLLVYGAITAALMLVTLLLPQRTLPPRLQLAKS